MDFLEVFVKEFDREMGATRRMLERVPEEQWGWRPHERSMMLGRLASHVSDLPNRAVQVVELETLVRQPGFAPYQAATKTEMLEKFESSAARAQELIPGLTEEQLKAEWSIRLGERVMMAMPRGMALRTIVMDHLIHHRGQLSVYLRLLDVPVPGVYGPSADDQPLG
ncbi:DinB family protein [Paracidobacterium acidisoli]|uniref:Damage-inducible protein DinB n=1 Tax=Paracidobacterium acidisoli TaxID=2303751 RepID=A0A372ITH6_9BACT|nr:DinB family protein [Paracidobacterium acidisoli]MBT9329657.1 DinB family protein [Paracidobacterium acidisoli]